MPVKTALLSRVPWPLVRLKKSCQVQRLPQRIWFCSRIKGIQFISAEFVHHCRKCGIYQSISRAGCPYNNAPMECYYNTLKTELIYQYRFETAAELDYAVSEFAYDFRYVHTRIMDIWLRLKRAWSVPLSSGTTKRVNHFDLMLLENRNKITTCWECWGSYS